MNWSKNLPAIALHSKTLQLLHPSLWLGNLLFTSAKLNWSIRQFSSASYICISVFSWCKVPTYSPVPPTLVPCSEINASTPGIPLKFWNSLAGLVRQRYNLRGVICDYSADHLTARFITASEGMVWCLVVPMTDCSRVVPWSMKICYWIGSRVRTR